jgi:hypothetical protein
MQAYFAAKVSVSVLQVSAVIVKPFLLTHACTQLSSNQSIEVIFLSLAAVLL